MKNQSLSSRVRRVSMVAAAIAAVVSSVGCMTTYDAYGRPVQSVDPGAAVAGVAAAGILGYALGNNHDHHYHGGYYGRGPHYYYR